MTGRELYDKGRYHYRNPPRDQWLELSAEERGVYDWLCVKHTMRLLEDGYTNTPAGELRDETAGCEVVVEYPGNHPSPAMSFQAIHLDSHLYEGRDTGGPWKIGVMVYEQQVHLTMQRDGEPGVAVPLQQTTCRELAANLRTVRPRRIGEPTRVRPLVYEEACDTPSR